MSADYFEEVITGLLERRPFQVFTVELNGGKRFEVDHPHAFSIRGGSAHFISPGGMPIWFDHNSVNHVYPAGAAMPTGSPSAPYQ
jgi:hypothetical protein